MHGSENFVASIDGVPKNHVSSGCVRVNFQVSHPPGLALCLAEYEMRWTLLFI